MISRDTSDARIPSVPIEMPSETAIVTNSKGTPPASRTATFVRLARSVERQVAWRDLVPARRDPDLGLDHVVVCQAHGAQHRPRRGTSFAQGDFSTAGRGVDRHGESLGNEHDRSAERTTAARRR